MVTSQEVRFKAAELALDADSPQEISRRIALFIRDDIPYFLDEWDVSAEDVLRKWWGMCAGKALLASELYRAVGIPVRFKVIKIMGEEGLFGFVARRLEDMVSLDTSSKELETVLRSILLLPPQRDHIIVQVFLDSDWVDMDLARDSELDYGMRFIGIWRERNIVSEEGPYESIDGWLQERMLRRAVTVGRQALFQVVNQHIEQVRQVGRICRKAGVQALIGSEIKKLLQGWDIVTGCHTCAGITGKSLDKLAKDSRAALSGLPEPERRQLEQRLVHWLYALARHNIKRGRLWELYDVLTQRWADCLGYARLLSFLATDFGLKAGVVEVVQDNAGRYVPHCVCLVNLADGQKMYIDPWYGSADVHHRLLAVRVIEAGRLVIKQFPMEAVESASEVYGLSQEQLAGISLYIMGNSYLDRGMETEAVECYDASLCFYPANSRTLFNRAIALERIRKEEKAQVDYHHAFSVDSSMARILATIEDIEPLIELDEKGISDSDQQIYLLRKGFVTGQEEEWAEIAHRCGTTSAEAQARFNLVMTKLDI